MHQAYQHSSAICQRASEAEKGVLGGFVKSEDNMADGAMKNLPRNLFTSHVVNSRLV